MIVVLTSIGLLSGGFLATVGLLTKDQIALNKQREIEEAIITVVPGTESSQKLYEERELSIYGGRDGTGAILGFAIYASGVGFQDTVTLMFGTNISITRITRLTILDQKETPGLGAKITDRKSFLQYWENKDCTQPLSLRKPPSSTPQDLSSSEINTITGATISSESVLNTVNVSLERLRALKKEGKFIQEE
jgi:electron transport complex protein RnfG